jgi:(2Fe-2S) ferredoxin
MPNAASSSRPVRLVVCINERLGSGQRSCVGSGSLDLINKLESMLAAEHLDVPIVRRECLGRCEQGPVMRIAPAGPFFCEIDAARLNTIIAELKAFLARRDA